MIKKFELKQIEENYLLYKFVTQQLRNKNIIINNKNQNLKNQETYLKKQKFQTSYDRFYELSLSLSQNLGD